ncbi:ubiquitin-protein ligase E3A [Rhypophila decipiens]
MTREASSRVVDGGHNANEIDVIAGLWEEARFARLPWDAPAELKDLVEDIDNPKRVYAIHRATRRHNFQLLVQRFIVQLRDGCGSDHCSTPTCFTCRKRIAGKAPLRRFNTTSARSMATYLASLDNAENNICPGLRSPKAPPAALNSLAFVPNRKDPLREREERAAPTSPARLQSGPPHGASPKKCGGETPPRPPRSRNGSVNGSPAPKEQLPSTTSDFQDQASARGPGFRVIEEPTSKDYRSFTANVFSTVAFKMLEWLTPASIEEMSRRADRFQTSRDRSRTGATKDTDGDSSRSGSPQSGSLQQSPIKSAEAKGDGTKPRGSRLRPDATPEREKLLKDEKAVKEDHNSSSASPISRPATQRRNSNAKLRTAPGPKPKRQLSIDPFASDSLVDEAFPAILKSPRPNGSATDRTPKGPKTANPVLTRPISQLSSAGFFDDVSLEKMPPPRTVEFKPKLGRSQVDGAKSSDDGSPDELTVPSQVSSSRSCSNHSVGAGEDSEGEDVRMLPQALSKLSADVVDFICDVVQEDGTAENHMLEPLSVARFHNKSLRQGKPLKRRSRPGPRRTPNLRLEWKIFVEQTLFYVLSDPQLAILSFTERGQLYDSQTLWYCMLRMTRIAPKLVFHSLWMASASLFPPPQALQALRSPTAKVFPNKEKSLSNLQAGRLISICLHTLIAAAPLVGTDRELYDMSRIRAHGLSLSGSGSVADQPVSLCLQYEDCFNDELAVRLAKRVFSAIITRRYYDEINELNLNNEEKAPDVLTPLFSQLDFLNMDSVYILNFSFPDRALHETRVPILLLDWARTVMLNEWTGSPEIPGAGAFGGALALIDAMYKKRHELLLGDAQFRAEYFAERLDTVQMPVHWLSHSPTRQKMHLLDFPYLFNSSMLVSYFRAINFSRMNRAYEEATSLQEKIEVITHRLELDQHHRSVLSDRLKTPSSKYLSLDIGRESVIQDAFNQLWRREERELLRPLKVHLGATTGEEGFDSGGVQQEFFRMAIAEALNPDYGAFSVDERTRMTWFVPGSMEPEWKFELVGLLVSLAVYNGLTLPVTFPKALYRKLLGEPVTELHHIADGWPDLASGLTTLLEWDEKDGLVEDVFARTYEFSVEVFGQVVTREMKPPPSPSAQTSSPTISPRTFKKALNRTKDEQTKWPQFQPTAWQAACHPSPQENNPDEDTAELVTNANRNAYVSDYIRYLADVSIRPQYEAFARGFRACLHPKSLRLLNSSILQSIVEGVQEIDISELKRYTRYVGWDSNHRTVRDFWSIVKRYDNDMKRKLLEFVTASDRVPVGGIKNMMFILQRNGSEEEPGGRLPSSYTCYGTLLLPEYRDREMLAERLGMALENARGFGFA